MKIDLEQIRDLLSVVGSNDITELTIESGDEKITVKKSGPVQIAAPVAATVELPVAHAVAAHAGNNKPAGTAAAAPKNEAPAAKSEGSGANANYIAITSPMVGTFYRASSPTAPPFVDVGDRVSVGQTVCIIEAMKLMNDLPAEVSGKVVKILVENGTTVEYGQQLFLLDPNG